MKHLLYSKENMNANKAMNRDEEKNQQQETK